MLDVNLAGLLYCTHAALPIMGAAGSGHIVNVASDGRPHRHTWAAASTT